MTVKTKSSDLRVHVIITVIGVAAAFVIGLTAGRSGQGSVDEQLGELKSGIEANAKQIDENKTLAAANESGIIDSLSRVNKLTVSMAREMTAAKAELASAGEKMTYVDKVLGLKWHTRYADGHRYCLIPYPLPWQNAQDFARKVGGSLVVINDEAENKWITKTFGSDTEFWIGLTDEVDEGKWLWVNDLDCIYKNWATGEPDNYKKMQHYVIMNKQAAKGATEAGKWNDIAGNEIKIGIIEAAR